MERKGQSERRQRMKGCIHVYRAREKREKEIDSKRGRERVGEKNKERQREEERVEMK